jgi:ElaB/YqjD/DUF883 family membrane-anchored ribosome-binding protein
MDSAVKTRHDNPAAPSLDKIVDDIAALRRDISALTSQLKSTAAKGAGEAIDEISGKAKELYGTLADQGERSAKVLGEHVKEQPLLSLVIAFLLGLVGSRLLSR